MNARPRVDAKLKTLTRERQEAIAEYARDHKLVDVVAWLRADGLATSQRALSEFLSWWQLQEQFRADGDTTEVLLEQLKKEVPGLSDAQLDELGQRTFSLLAIRREDPETFLKVRSARFKAEIEKEKLKLRQSAEARHQEQFRFEREKWVQESCNKILAAATDVRTREIAEMSVPNAEKIKLLRQHWFADVDELEKAGGVKLPPIQKKQA